jgi:hypothetical protein
MYQQKVSKKEMPDKNDFTIHSKTAEASPFSFLLTITDPCYRIVSIDPATDNFGFRIEERYPNRITTIAFDKVKFDRSIVESGSSILYNQIYEFLDRYKQYYPSCHIFLIERQMAINYRATRIGQAVISYFIMQSRSNTGHSIVVEIDPKIKGKMLGDCCINLFTIRQDCDGYKILMSHKKRDDLADTVIQIEAFFKRIGLRLTTSPPQRPCFVIEDPAPQTLLVIED